VVELQLLQGFESAVALLHELEPPALGIA